MAFGDPIQRQGWVRAALLPSVIVLKERAARRDRLCYCLPSGMWSVLRLRNKGVIWGQL